MKQFRCATISYRLRVHLILAIIISTVVRSTAYFSPAIESRAIGKNKFILGMQMDEFRTMTAEEDGYLKYVHESIRDILDAEPIDLSSTFAGQNFSKENETAFVDMEDCLIQWDVFEEYIKLKNQSNMNSPSHITMDSLLTLASQCQKALFRQRITPLDIPPPICGLIDVSGVMDGPVIKERVLIATLLSLNMVESSIRNLSGKQHGRAPLLKDMIQLISENEELGLPSSLSLLLRSLLLPNDGVNLRNLLWHGFVPGLKSHWLALSIVLTLSLDEIARNAGLPLVTDNPPDDCFDGLDAMRAHPELVEILDHGHSIISSVHSLENLDGKLMTSSFIPDTHKELARITLQLVNYPVIFASITGPLVEHTLRLWWCEANKRHLDAVARPGSYYVTLDGHGQRDKHDVVLLPYLSMGDVEPTIGTKETDTSSEIRNKLVDRIGKNKMDLLVDLFASPPGSPNIRASVAHGSFNSHLYKELCSLKGRQSDQKEALVCSSLQLRDMSCALVSVLDLLGSTEEYEHGVDSKGTCCELSLHSYRPIFSYSASLLREIDNAVNALILLHGMVADENQISFQSDIQRTVSMALKSLTMDLDTIKSSRARILNVYDAYDTPSHDYSINIIASDCGAAGLLLAEITSAVSKYVDQVANAITQLENYEERPSSRRRKQLNRLLSLIQVNRDFYSFATLCALLYIEGRFVPNNELKYSNLNKEDLFLAVKRSRMVVSTFSTVDMIDRALKAVDNYLKGKAVKVVATEIARERIQTK